MKKNNKQALILFVAGLLLISASLSVIILTLGTEPELEKNPQLITVDEAFDAKDYTCCWEFIDSRSDEEYASGHICNATHVNFSDFIEFMKISGFPKDKHYIIYNNDGNATLLLRCKDIINWGFENVYYLEGGFSAWKDYGLEVCEGLKN